MNTIINVTIRDRIARSDKNSRYVCGNSDFVVKFDFDDEWENYETKTARFKYRGVYQDVVFDGVECPVPVLYNIYNFRVGVFAGNLKTTTEAHISATKGVLCENGSPDSPPDDVYSQIMEKLNGLANVPIEQIEAAVSAYLEKNPVDGVDEDELLEAVENALTEAKKSGEFKGDPGEPGYTPQKGVDYFDGEPGEPGAAGHTPEKGVDYWTAADKQEIVSDVLAALPNASGVNF